MAKQNFLARAYRAEPVLINALLSLAIAVAVHYGLGIDDEALAAFITALFGVNIAVDRGVVYAPRTVEKLTKQVEVNTRNETMARVTLWANEQASRMPEPQPVFVPPSPAPPDAIGDHEAPQPVQPQPFGSLGQWDGEAIPVGDWHA